MRYRLTIFDFDGTLADSFDGMLEEFAAVAREHGFRSFDLARLDHYRGMDGRALMKELGMPAWKMPAVVTAMRRRLAGRLASTRLFDGAAECLAALRAQGVRIAVVSSNSRANVEAVLGAQTGALVDHYACGAAMFGKARHFRQVVRRARVAAGETVCVGDEVRDAEAAAAAGLAFAAVGWGYALPAALAATGAPVLTTFDELTRHVTGAA